MKWFNNPKTLEELKKQYKALALKHHPDRGGKTFDMQTINAEYDILFARLKNIHTSASGNTYTATTETTETPDEFKNIIDKLIHLDGLQIEICGSWLWITGTTFKHKAVLKALKFRWSKSKAAWYYHTADYRKSSNKTFTLDQIRDLYGSEAINTEPQLKLSII
ncbi:MAG: J domain-containing protein [Hominilimicola sp.]